MSAITEARPRPPIASKLTKVGERFGIIGLWAVMIIVYSAVESSTFDTNGTFQVIFGSQAALIFLAMAFLCTIIVGEFVDLSIASILGLCATIVPVLTVFDHFSVVVASVIAVAVGIAAGAINGLLAVYAGVNTIVVTLGMSTLLTGIALAISHLGAVTGLSTSFGKIALANVGGWPFGGLPVSFYYGIGLVLVFAYVLAFTPLGRHMQFVGANREVSRLAGVRVNAIRFGAFVAAGALCGIGGVVVAAGVGGFDPTTTSTYLLPAVSAVFLGTAVIRPGRFNPIGTLIAVYFLATGIQGLEELNLSEWISYVFYGAALIIAVLLTTLLRRRNAT